MTDNDNKDPQIREAFEKWWIDTRMHGHNIPPNYKDAVTNVQWGAWQAATEQQATELKQLRADNEISESTQAALYKSLLIIQRKYEQLRAERQWQDISTAPKDGTKILAYLIDNAEHRKSFPENERNGIDIIVWTNHNKGGWISNRFGTPTYWQPLPLPDKLTDSAQSIKEG